MRQILFLRDPGYTRCPSCKNVSSLHRSRARSFKEKLIKATKLYKIYRCKTCGWRGYFATIVITKKDIKLFFMYGAIALLSGLIIREILKRFLTT
ncbi:MAG: hypothetical protein COZ80_08450 [Ignavibacteria bacterium CG_4_8_14_3_um_filter_37_9]|nr:hypothetical protein [Ignavibacteria bacterium]OIO18335.1 MAG: hypothetical protein AUJ54_08165 [Ignavibacteria bacterium CG1_02_37_35]PIP78267.1 MAG: hypothetical protein COW85_04810 [Ignavibacteria bacterium CG22_combo_CG10-13_8_21_14_all_37_15]PIS45601.1 MAG: hypothetical protein COT22_04380 [Ignavibacteria bacterium CG08_land_8_20_14_0_20_37_9]PIW98848.1 MAG: hypothetical protein COZ80_08450 [Ignavibacteria bacterium CG_4_8_14_3_um_filter_37_9]PIX94044.1 MAG: hypothetical protein COZ25_